jgi:hypothetical protein
VSGREDQAAAQAARRRARHARYNSSVKGRARYARYEAKHPERRGRWAVTMRLRAERARG